MYLERIRLRNIACFEDLSLDFTRRGRPCPWVVILGENGCGKSTLLQMIALSLVGGDMIHEIAGGVDWGRFARSSSSPGRIDLELLPTRGDVIEMPQPRIYLSYSHPDREKVWRLYQQLAAAGMRPWMDVEDILPGEEWEKRLREAMQGSDLILVCLSRESPGRSSHQAEVLEALEISKQKDEGDIYVIPVRLELCDVPEPLNHLLWVDLFQEGGFERLEKAIHTAMERRGVMLPPRGGGLKNSRGELRLRAAHELGSEIRTGLRQAEDLRHAQTILDRTLYAQTLTGGWFACAYGPWRRLSRAKVPSRSSQALTTSRRKSYRFGTMFEEEPALTLVNDWLIDLEFRRLKEPDNHKAQEALDLAVRSIERMLPEVRFRTITSEGEVIFEESGVEVSIDHLSDGYRSTVAWIGDLVRRLVDAFPEGNPLEAPGVVLVDELDLHLHPNWQRSIVDEVRKLFPNLQFIVSSHSPFVAQEAGEADKIIVLKRRGPRVEADEGLDSVKGWRVDQILTSYLFDLETTRDASIAAAEREYQALLDRQAGGAGENADETRIRELKEWLDQHKSAPGETVAENEIFEAARSFINLIDRQTAP